MSGSGFDIRSKRVSIPKEFSVATPEEFVKKFGGNRVINKVVQLSDGMRKPAFCICENKGGDQLRSNCTAGASCSNHC